jgi:hypothetical protein
MRFSRGASSDPDEPGRAWPEDVSAGCGKPPEDLEQQEITSAWGAIPMQRIGLGRAGPARPSVLQDVDDSGGPAQQGLERGHRLHGEKP